MKQMQKQYRQAMRCFKQLIISSVSILLLLILSALSSNACDIRLKPNVKISSDSIYLKDIAAKYPKRFKNLFIANSPYINNPLTLTKDYVKSILKRQHANLTVCGNSSRIKRKIYYLTKKSLKRIIKDKNVKILSKMPIALPYDEYKINVKKISDNGHFVWIELSIFKRGQFYRSIGISAKKLITALYPVAKYGIRRGELITPNMIKFIKINKNLGTTAFKSLQAIVGKIAIADIKQNEPFTGSNTKRNELVKMGDLVKVQVIDGDIKINTVAKALRSGFKSDIIPIMYLKSKRVATATIIGSKEVEVQ